jgi:diguanylate cyclase (GGDEF)-like protein
MGAADFIAKPFKPAPVLARVKSQLRRIPGTSPDLHAFAAVAAAPATSTRRHFDAALTLEWERALEAGDPVALLLIHVDHFERHREAHGRVQANAGLRELVELLKDVSRRPGDLLARCSEDAFALLLPRTRSAGASQVARRLLESVELLNRLAAKSAIVGAPSVSIGVSCHDDSGRDALPGAGDPRGSRHGSRTLVAADLIVAADDALAHARRAGGEQAWQRDLHQAGIQPAAQLLATTSFDPCPRAA